MLHSLFLFVKLRGWLKLSNRVQTRDLLLEYDKAVVPPRPRAAGLGVIYSWLNSNTISQGELDVPPIPNSSNIKSIYPWENLGLTILSNQLYQIAVNSGYTGTKEEFNTYFGFYLEHNRQEIIFDVFSHFPQIGTSNQLYFDLNEKILYYWDNEYIPVNTMLIANTIVDGGEA